MRSPLCCLCFLFVLISTAVTGAEPPKSQVLLPPREGNPRNSEGDFVVLKNGDVLLIYTHFYGGSGDHAQAHLASRISHDGGKTWSQEDKIVVPNEGGLNVMSVSLLRLADGRIALFYLRKNAQDDCRPHLRHSEDEGATWSEPICTIPDADIGYYILNNDRAVQLASGRILLPVAQHRGPGMPERNNAGLILCYYSDDAGQTWKRSAAAPRPPKRDGQDVITQEPGVVALKDDRLMLWCRTDAGSQFVSYSSDDGESWSQLKPSDMISPLAPATIERIPSTGDLLLFWNDHHDVPDSLRGKRTPLRCAISSDDGQTWTHVKTLEENPNGWYCYLAVAFDQDQVLMAYCAGLRGKGQGNGLQTTNVQRLPVDWFYAK
ncbi:glycoside hydrolase [Blastopirellula sp. JC732]|uniref:Glycoside hydrolase n=1 Tax=Blastopirellula sediminis TaxID=2894196 RepID=A0A9X1SIC6_9BACT|nr:sialidase family protein [Blastopirellula sediminis]MCC9605608.1 glycoside hydrolase [Blastopirellula sediminis]MCC9631092.1 glycoside hydrolase [Blastopirellula sediminis]